MKKNIFILLIIALVSTTFTSCEKTEPTYELNKVTLTVDMLQTLKKLSLTDILTVVTIDGKDASEFAKYDGRWSVTYTYPTDKTLVEVVLKANPEKKYFYFYEVDENLKTIISSGNKRYPCKLVAEEEEYRFEITRNETKTVLMDDKKFQW
jgi:hypothetical protein